MDHQTQLDLSPDRFLSSGSGSPEIILGTPPQSRDRSIRPHSKGFRPRSRKDLLPHFSQVCDTLETEVPRWMYDEDLVNKENTPISSRTGSGSSLSNSLCMNSPHSSRLSTAGSTPGSSVSHSGLSLAYSSGSRTKTSTPSSQVIGSQRSPNSQFYPMSGSGLYSGSTLSLSSENSVLQKILTEIKTSNEKLAKLEKEVLELKDGPPTIKKRKLMPSREVREVVRKVYKALVESDEKHAWDTDQPISHSSNEAIVQKLVLESKQQLTDTSSAVIKEAVRTYFHSISGTERLKATGKYETKCIQQKRRNRLMRKLQSRKVALQKTTAIPENEKSKWEEGLIPELMSSEESDDENGFTVHPLPWRSDKADKLFMSLDHKSEKRKSRRSKVMTLKRSEGLPSDRRAPSTAPGWALNIK